MAALANDSPHKEGNTCAALQELAKTLEAKGIDAEIFGIGLNTAGGCISCWKCSDRFMDKLFNSEFVWSRIKAFS
ncbi:MAG: hypothetical protein LBU32_24625 [Clostridiales bacterium]|jgi:multimeric flavodoxin WrbA|nr:hypothetical protein [Clostridiales bacterium]